MTVNASRKELRCRSFAPDDRFHRQRRKELEVEGLTAALGERSTSAMAIATGHGRHAPAVELRQAAQEQLLAVFERRRLAEKAFTAVVQGFMCMASRPARSTISSGQWA
jgi:hypothetical protein